MTTTTSQFIETLEELASNVKRTRRVLELVSDDPVFDNKERAQAIGEYRRAVTRLATMLLVSVHTPLEVIKKGLGDDMLNAVMADVKASTESNREALEAIQKDQEAS